VPHTSLREVDTSEAIRHNGIVAYYWPRFWSPWDENHYFEQGGYLPDPASTLGSLNRHVVGFDKLEPCQCLVFLGPPGMGKSTALSTARELAEARSGRPPLHFDLRSYGNETRLVRDIFESDEISRWRSGQYVLELFVDSLDECMIRISHLTPLLVDQLRRLPFERLKLRLACRTAAFPDFLASELCSLWSTDASQDEKRVRVMELMPLREQDVRHAAHSNGLDENAFMAAIERADAVPLANRPITLKFLLATYTSKGKLPSTREELYRDGCRQLCEEKNPQRRSSSDTRGRLSIEQRMAVAERIAAVTMLCGRGTILLDTPDGQVGDDEVVIRELSGGHEVVRDDELAITDNALLEVLQDTGLFSSRGPNRVGWTHQVYPEYLAACYLQSHNVNGTQTHQLLMHHAHSGLVVPQLCETAAWLSNMRREFFEDLIQTDPQVILRCDTARLRDEDRAKLVEKLLSGFENGRLLDDWWSITYDYSQLSHPALGEQLMPVLLDREKRATTRKIALSIARECRVQALSPVLVKLALDGGEPLSIRRDAAECIRAIGEPDARLALKALLKDLPDDPMTNCVPQHF
jgi:hypothetical protein